MLCPGWDAGDSVALSCRFPQLQAQTNGGRPDHHRHRYGPPGGETDAMATTNGARGDCSGRWVAGSPTSRTVLDERHGIFSSNTVLASPSAFASASRRASWRRMRRQRRKGRPPLSRRAEVLSVIVEFHCDRLAEFALEKRKFNVCSTEFQAPMSHPSVVKKTGLQKRFVE